MFLKSLNVVKLLKLEKEDIPKRHFVKWYSKDSILLICEMFLTETRASKGDFSESNRRSIVLRNS